MRKYRILATIAIVAGLSIGSLQAQEATSLAELLDRVRDGRVDDDAAHRDRMDEFRRDAARQAELLNQARAERTRQEQLSAQLEQQQRENELLIVDVQAQLDERLGSLRELFGVLQQVAGDARSQFEESLTNIEYPERGEFLTALAAKMGQGSTLPTIGEIEQIWFELQREATELGRVKRLPNFTFSSANGEQITEDIVRVGAFNLIADGRYLDRDSDTNIVSELQRQPSEARFINSTSNLMAAQPGDDLVRFGIDITRGELLRLLIATPDLVEQIQQGRQVGYVIIVLGIIGVLLALERLITLTITGRKVKTQLKSTSAPNSNNPLGRVLKVYHDNPNTDTETLELKLGEAILKELPSLQRGILFIKVISVVAPLLGLLGTVTGMIQTFQAMALFGTGDASVMADGISQALMTTVLGLCVAIPTVLLHTLVSGRSKRIIQILQEQSAGIVATEAEKGH
jgi:biopolymer transport protein ExbB